MIEHVAESVELNTSEEPTPGVSGKGSLTAWVKASRLQSQSYIFIPILLGQACAYAFADQFHWMIFILLHLFGLFNQLYIVYANDYADRNTDKLNKTFNLFSGGSRVLVEGSLRPAQIRNAAWLMALLCLTAGLSLTLAYDRIYALPLILLGLALLWSYSYGPLKLSYRGGGELLQMLGVGLVLPIFAFYAQAGTFQLLPMTLILSFLPIQLACAMSTSLPDEPSDRVSGKRTASVLLGLRNAQRAIIGLSLLSLLLVALDLYAITQGSIVTWLMLIPFVLILSHLRQMGAQPGSKGMELFNILTVGTVLLLQVLVIIPLFQL